MAAAFPGEVIRSLVNISAQTVIASSMMINPTVTQTRLFLHVLRDSSLISEKKSFKIPTKRNTTAKVIKRFLIPIAIERKIPPVAALSMRFPFAQRSEASKKKEENRSKALPQSPESSPSTETLFCFTSESAGST